MVLKYVLDTGQEIHGPPYSMADEAGLYASMATVKAVMRSAPLAEASPPSPSQLPPSPRRQPPAPRQRKAVGRPSSEQR
jgi:hypothetical protein